MSIQIKNLDIPAIRVKVDHEKCQFPVLCEYKCYTKCNQGIFHIHSSIHGAWMKPDPNSPKNYVVYGGAAPKCIGCMKCTENCPENAITIEIAITKKEEGEHPYGHPYESLAVGTENQELMDKLDLKHEGLIKK